MVKSKDRIIVSTVPSQLLRARRGTFPYAYDTWAYQVSAVQVKRHPPRSTARLLCGCTPLLTLVQWLNSHLGWPEFPLWFFQTAASSERQRLGYSLLKTASTVQAADTFISPHRLCEIFNLLFLRVLKPRRNEASDDFKEVFGSVHPQTHTEALRYTAQAHSGLCPWDLWTRGRQADCSCLQFQSLLLSSGS